MNEQIEAITVSIEVLSQEYPDKFKYQMTKLEKTEYMKIRII